MCNKDIILSKNPNRRKGEIYDLRGEKYGKLYVSSFNSKDKYGRARWNCLCSCGVEKIISANHLRTGKTLSCGCLSRDNASIRMTKLKTKHGLSKENWYTNWNSMVGRVTNKEHQNYNRYMKMIDGKVIEDEWIDNPLSFYEHIGDKPSEEHTIDRIDNSKGYIKGNVRWATRETQSINRTHSKNTTTGIRGITKISKGTNGLKKDRYHATIHVKKKTINLGYYDTIDEAKIARYMAEDKYGYPHTFSVPRR